MWIKMSGALLAAMSMVSLADAGLFSSKMGCGAEKGCGCASTCQPACCKPVIVKPCCPNVYTYQRKCSDIKPPCCDTCCPPATCCAPAACAPACAAPAAHCAPAACAPACAAPAATCAPAAAPACAAPAACAPAPAACAPACAAPAATCAPAACAPACAAPAAAAPHCCPAPAAATCCAPAAPTCATPCAPTCCAPTACCETKKCGLLDGLFGKMKKMDCGSCNTCAAPCAPATCAAPCEVRCCNADPCEIAKLIYESQTACYAKDRRKAIHKLGDNFDCICNPEIMTAFIVGLNDCDERVRWKAADEIGDQIRKNCCCCPEVVAALTCALGDCDKHVVKQATEALELCGYEVVDGCCDPCAATCSTTGACGNGCAPHAAPAPMPTPAPMPPTTTKRSSNLSNLLGLLD